MSHFCIGDDGILFSRERHIRSFRIGQIPFVVFQRNTKELDAFAFANFSSLCISYRELREVSNGDLLHEAIVTLINDLYRIDIIGYPINKVRHTIRQYF